MIRATNQRTTETYTTVHCMRVVGGIINHCGLLPWI